MSQRATRIPQHAILVFSATQYEMRNIQWIKKHFCKHTSVYAHLISTPIQSLKSYTSSHSLIKSMSIVRLPSTTLINFISCRQQRFRFERMCILSMLLIGSLKKSSFNVSRAIISVLAIKKNREFETNLTGTFHLIGSLLL